MLVQDLIKAVKEGQEKSISKPEQEPVAKAMTAERALYFMERFKHEEKLLGQNEQAAVDFVISMLEAPPQRKPLSDEEIKMLIPDGEAWKYGVGFQEATEFARAIEAAHGIKGE